MLVTLSVRDKTGRVASKESPSRHSHTNSLSFLIQEREGQRGVQGASVSILSSTSSVGGEAKEMSHRQMVLPMS